MKKIAITMQILSLILTGCANTNSQFDCPMKPGVNCESIDRVNAKVDSGELGHEGSFANQPIAAYRVRHIEKINVSSYEDFYQRKPLRYGETVQRVWIAPFEDTAGNYHQESNVYTIVKPAHWIGYPVKSVNEEE